ncbi:MAG TPA: peptidylprolyl isomerase [Armatimonadota bacterium]|nr:peptidylprolyl isomerase [Armatimonadota bacterium]
MSLMSMRRKMASKKTATYILWSLIVVFLVGVALWSVPGKGIGKQYGDSPFANKVVAKINGEKVTAGQIDEEFYKQQDNGQQYDLQSAPQTRFQIFDGIVHRLVAEQTAKKLHVRTWSWTLRSVAREVAQTQLASMHAQAQEQAKAQAASAKTPADKSKLQTADQMFKAQLSQALSQYGDTTKNPTEDDFVRAFVRTAMSRQEKVGMYDQLVSFAQTYLIGEEVAKDQHTSPFSEDFAKKVNTKEVKASWIFIAAPQNNAQGLNEAKQKASKLHEDIIKAPNTFAAVAKKESADFMTKTQGGDLGWVSLKSSNVSIMAQYLAFIQREGEIGPIVEIAMSSPFGGPSQIGYAFVKVDAIRDSADAKDFNWAKEKESAMVSTKVRFAQGFGQNYLELQTAKAKIVRLSDELKYYDAMMTNPVEAEKLVTKLQDDKSIPPVVAAAFKYQVAEKTTDPAQKAVLLENVISYGGAQVPNLQMELGRAYTASGQKDKALQQFGFVADGADSNDPDHSMHTALKTEYAKLGDTKNVQRMVTWMKSHPKQAAPQGMGGGMPMMMNR